MNSPHRETARFQARTSGSIGRRALTWALAGCGALLLGGSARAQSLVNGGVVSGTISTPGETHTFTFDTRQKDRYTLRLVDVDASPFSPRIDVYNPHGALLRSSADADVAVIETTKVMGGGSLASGTYTVVVSDASEAHGQTGAYELHFVKMPDAPGEKLLDGLTVVDEIALGEVKVFKFQAEPGQLIEGRIEALYGSTLHIRNEKYYPPNGYSWGTGTVSQFSTVSQGGTHSIVLSDSRGSGTGLFSIVVRGIPAAPPYPPNVFLPRFHQRDPQLLDIGGHGGLGPKVGDPREPFNVSLDCHFMQSPSFYSLSIWTGVQSGQSTPWGLLYTDGQRLLRKSGRHTQSVETWFPPDTGLPLPNDPSLVGMSYTVQGICGGGLYHWQTRLSTAITQTIGG